MKYRRKGVVSAQQWRGWRWDSAHDQILVCTSRGKPLALNAGDWLVDLEDAETQMQTAVVMPDEDFQKTYEPFDGQLKCLYRHIGNIVAAQWRSDAVAEFCDAVHLMGVHRPAVLGGEPSDSMGATFRGDTAYGRVFVPHESWLCFLDGGVRVYSDDDFHATFEPVEE